MSLRDQIAEDAITVFTSTDDFAEAVYYYDVQQVNPKSINAVVFRNEISIVSEDGDTALPVWEVHVVNDDRLGISSTELDLGGDQLEFAPRDGQDAVRKTITRLVSQDHGMLVIECR